MTLNWAENKRLLEKLYYDMLRIRLVEEKFSLKTMLDKTESIYES